MYRRHTRKAKATAQHSTAAQYEHEHLTKQEKFDFMKHGGCGFDEMEV
jgi:hypothetical protein